MMMNEEFDTDIIPDERKPIGEPHDNVDWDKDDEDN